MLKLNFKSFVRKIKKFFKLLKPLEKIILYTALLGIIIGLLGLFWRSGQKDVNIEPVSGGEIIEGIIAGSAQEATQNIQNLIGIGIVRFNENGEIVGAIASKYEVNADGKEYRFEISERANIEDVIAQLKDSKSQLENAEIMRQDNTIVIRINTPFAPLLANLTKPIIEPGPYKIVHTSKKDIDLIANDDFVFGKPLIPKIKIVIYQNQDQLKSALAKNEITSAYNVSADEKSFDKYSLLLPRYMVLFLNTKRAPWDQIINRLKLADLEKFSEPTTINITTVGGETQKFWIEELEKRFEPINVRVNENIVSESQLNTEIIPKRDYESILVGIDIGRDPDPYYFWHSSEISESGQNLSNFSSKNIDLLLEQSRLITDFSKRMERYNQVNDIIRKEAAAIFLERKQVDYLVDKKIKNIKIKEGITDADRFGNVWQWYIKTKKVTK